MQTQFIVVRPILGAYVHSSSFLAWAPLILASKAFLYKLHFQAKCEVSSWFRFNSKPTLSQQVDFGSTLNLYSYNKLITVQL